MTRTRVALTLGLAVVAAGAFAAGAGRDKEDAMAAKAAETGPLEVYSAEKQGVVATERVVRSEDEWRKQLRPEQFQVLRKQGTERAFSGAYWDEHKDGIYRCAGCGNDLFDAHTKFDSGTGWPSFYEPIASANVATREDHGFFTTRNEVVCRRCGGHLGHVFDDGPKPTGLRYCMNSAALSLVPRPAVAGATADSSR